MKKKKDEYVTAICPRCGRFMDKIESWVCKSPSCGKLKER